MQPETQNYNNNSRSYHFFYNKRRIIFDLDFISAHQTHRFKRFFVLVNMKAFILIVTISILNATVCDESFVRNKSYRCFASNKTVRNYNCFAKSYSRTHQTINVFLNVTRKITHWMVIYKIIKLPDKQ